MPSNPHRNCRPLGTNEVAAYMTRRGYPVEESTVRKWRQRGVMDDEDFMIGGRPVWTVDTIDKFMRRTGRTGEKYQAKVDAKLPTKLDVGGEVESEPEPEAQGRTLICHRCRRPVDPWPLERGAVCSPGNWAVCIRNDGRYASSILTTTGR